MAKGQNPLLNQIEAQKQKAFDVGEEMGMQKMWDYVQMALRCPDVCGAVPFGEKQFKRLYQKLIELADEYKIAFTQHDEADYKQEEMDERLKPIWGDNLQPFYSRYPHLKKFNYTTGKWK